MYLLLDRI